MCGMYGFVGKSADADVLIQLAEAAATRGGHASAIVWSSNGIVSQSRMRGVLRHSSVRMASGARVVLGHERYATSGNPHSIAETHPFVRGDLYLMHNGLVADYERRARHYSPRLTTSCDTELLALMVIDRLAAGSSLAVATQNVLHIAGQWGAIIAMRGNEVVAGANHCPLYVAHREEGDYFCSRAVLPDSRKLRDVESWRIEFAIPEAA